MSALAVLWFFLDIRAYRGLFRARWVRFGRSVLYRALAKTDAERALVRRSIGPVIGMAMRCGCSRRAARCLLRFRGLRYDVFRGFTWRLCSCSLVRSCVRCRLSLARTTRRWAARGCVLYNRFVFACPAVRCGARQRDCRRAACGERRLCGRAAAWLAFAVYARRWRAGICGMCMAAGAAWVALKTERTSAVHGVRKKSVACGTLWPSRCSWWRLCLHLPW